MVESRGLRVGDVESGFQSYPKYKDSGVEWLGEIPAHWKVKRLKDTVRSCQTGIWGDDPVGENDVVCVRVADFNRTTLTVDLDEPTLRTINPRVTDRHLLQSGDLLLEKSGGGDLQPVGVVVLFSWTGRAVCSNFIARMTVRDRHCCSSFLTYLHDSLYRAGINKRSIKQSTGIQNLDSKSYLNERVAMPNLEEQRAVAAFLDTETERTDNLIQKKQLLVELLQQRRTATISHAVTKGLRSGVPMQDTGIEWLGAIPAHWELIELGRTGSFWKGRGGTKLDERDTGIPCVRYGDLYTCHHHFVRQPRSCVTPEVASDYTSIRYGDLLFAASGETVEDIGKSAVNLLRSKAVCGGDIILFRSQRDCVPRFMGYAVDSPHAAYQKATMGRGFTVAHIYIPQLKQLQIPFPPYAEQEMIANYLERETNRIDDLIDRIDLAMALLGEYRKALISATVAGAIDVRSEGSPAVANPVFSTTHC